MKYESVFPMTEMQKGIAYECSLNEDKDVYVSQAILKLNYDDIDTYKKCWSIILNRFEVFRTKFLFGELEDDVQVVMNEAPIQWKVVNKDITKLDELADEERKISLSDLPISKFIQVNTSKDIYLIWTFHHITLDGWSMSLTLDNVDKLYALEKENLEIPNFKDNSYSEYVKWLLTNSNNQDELFWRDYLKNYEGKSIKNISRINNEEFSTNNLILHDIKNEIQEYCKFQKITPTVFFEAIWSLILYRYSFSNDIVFNVIESGRSINTMNILNTIGLTIQSFPKRIKIIENQNFNKLLNEIQKDDNLLRDKTKLPLRKINQFIDNKNIQSTFVFENYPSQNTSENYELVSGLEKSSSELTFSSGFDDNNNLHLKLMTSNGLMDNNQATQILEEIKTMIGFVYENKEIQINELLNKVGKSIVKSSSKVIEKISFFDKINGQKLSNPLACAIIDNNKTYTYEMLIQSCINSIGTYQDIRTNKSLTVGILMNRSYDNIVLMITLQYLGIPYVHLDPKNGQERMKFIIDDAEIKTIFIDNNNINYTFSNKKLKIIKFDSRKLENFSQNSLPRYHSSECYQLIYTSGSTGNPKGIKVKLENILSFTQNNDFFNVDSSHNFANASSMGFDASNFEIWLPLFNGASVTIIPEPVFDISIWEKQIEKYKINVAWITSSLFNTFVDQNFTKLKGLKDVFVGGEALSSVHISKAYQLDDNVTIYNGYGPTELTTFTTTYKIPRNFNFDNPIPIGQLLNNTYAKIIDKDNNVVPLNIPGELIVNSNRMIDSYMNENNNKSFINIEENGQDICFYRTGDIVYFDGELFHYFKRKDKQIKLRGFRIELGEIGNIISKIHGIKQNVVLFINNEICSFYVGEIDQESLKKELTHKLASYMMPAKLIKLSYIPLTINGKIDKKELYKYIENDNVKVSNEMEYKKINQFTDTEIENIFSEILQISEVNLNNNFFDYGKDSLSIVKINNKLNEKSGKNKSLKEIMMCKSLKEVANLHFPTIKHKKLNVPLSSMQIAMYINEINNPNYAIYNIPFLKKISKCKLQQLDIINKFKDFTIQNDIFNIEIVEKNGELVWNYKKSEKDNVFEYSVSNKESLSNIISQRINYKFDLKDSSEQLIQLSLITYEDEVYICLVVHHIIFDGHSMELLINHLFNDSSEVSHTNNYLEYLKNESLNTNLEETKIFWKKKLKDTQFDLNIQKEQKFNFDFKGAISNIGINSNLVAKISEYSKSRNISQFVVYQSIFAQFLIYYFNQESVIVGSPISNRSDEYNNTLGLFINFLPFKNTRYDEKNLNQIIDENKYEIYDIVENSTISLQEIIRDCTDYHSNNGLSIIQAVLNYQKNYKKELEWTKNILNRNHNTAQFPLTFTVYEGENSFLQIEYATTLFKETEINSIAHQFLNWTERIIDNTECNIGNIPIFDLDQSENIISKNNPNFNKSFNISKNPYTHINEQNKNLAIIDSNKKISYYELYNEIENLNNLLIKSKAQKNDKILFYGGRSWDQVIVFYTCLKYGYTYIPIDNSHSKSRLRQIVEEVSPNYIFTNIYNRENKDFNGYNTLLDHKFKRFNVIGSNDTIDISYIIFTSGTTGIPKGVQISKENLLHFINSILNDYAIESSWNHSFISSISFDASIFEMVASLVFGNTLVIYNDDSLITGFLEKYHVNFLIITPALLSVLNFNECIDLKLIVSGGDKFRPNKSLPAHVVTLNGYGPSEASICVSYSKISNKTESNNIGIPVSNSCIVITDKNHNLVPNNIIGEISIVGPSVTPSYVSIKDNKNKIIPSPSYLNSYGDILYKTGDIGFFNDKHELMFIGRNDNQVKVRGHRIELSEISSAVIKTKLAKEAVTLVKTTHNENNVNIYTYVIPENKSNFNKELLLLKLKSNLPTYMIPNEIIIIDSIPLTINKKIDTNALLEIETQKNTNILMNPCTELEKIILNVWEEVLNNEDIGVTTNFYDVGGDSIKSIQIVSKLREKDIYISSKDILNYQTVRHLVESDIIQFGDNTILDVENNLNSFSLTPIQEWFFNLELPNVNHWNQSRNFKFKLKNISLKDIIFNLYLKHPLLRGKVIYDGNTRTIQISDIENINLDNFLIQCDNQEDFVAKINISEESLNIYNGDISRIIYIQEKDYVNMYWIVHHLFIDTYSWEILENDIQRLTHQLPQLSDTHDISINEKVIQAIDNKTPKLQPLSNSENRIYEENNNTFTIQLNKENNNNINYSRISAAAVISYLLQIFDNDLSVLIEKNARFTDTLKSFNMNNSVGWMTEINKNCFNTTMHFKQILSKLDNLDVEKEFKNNSSEIFLNMSNINTSIEDIHTSAHDIAKENLNNMPPMVNIIEFEDVLSINLINIKYSDTIIQKSKVFLNEIFSDTNMQKYITIVENFGDDFLTLEEFNQLNCNDDLSTIYPLFPLQSEMIYSSFDESNSYLNDFQWTTKLDSKTIIDRYIKLTHKYEALRTQIKKTQNNSFFQVVINTLFKPFYKEIDLTHHAENDREWRIEESIKGHSTLHKNYNSQYLHGLYLYKISESEIRVVWIFNHLILDGWSTGIIINHLWHNNLDSSNIDSNLNYFKWMIHNIQNNKQNNFRLNENVTIGRIFNENIIIKDDRVKNIEYFNTLTSEITNKIKLFLKNNNTTLANLMKIIWGSVLAHVTDSKSVLFGFVDSGRAIPIDNIESKVGLFITTEANLIQISPEKSVVENLNDNKNQNLGFEGLDSSTARELLKIPYGQEIYETLLVIENYPEASAASDLIYDITANEQSSYPLTLSVGLNDKLHYKVSYNPNMLSKNQIDNIINHLENLLINFENIPLINNLKPELNKTIGVNDKQNSAQDINKKNILRQDSIDINIITKLWKDIIGHQNFTINSDFFEIGGTSLKLSQLVFILREDYGYELDTLGFFENPTLSFFKKGDFDSLQNIDDLEIIRELTVYKASPIKGNKVLVTGGVGLLGSEIVYQNLLKGNEVHCIVRAKNDNDAFKRLYNRLNYISDNKIPNINLLFVYQGDIAKNNLDLSNDIYQKLASTITTIYNCAGNVNFMSSFKDSYETNVQGLANIIKFSQENLIKKLNHISTLSVLGHDHNMIEDVDLAPISYVKTKVLAEKYLRSYRSHRDGLYVSRIGRIVGNSRISDIPSNDLFWRLLISIIELECCPKEFLEFETDLTPVDYIVSELIKHTENHSENYINNYFSKCMISFSKCIEIVEEILDKKIEKISYEEWLNKAENDPKTNKIKALIPLFRKNVFYEPEENSVVTKDSPDISIQQEIQIENLISEDVVKRYIERAIQSI